VHVRRHTDATAYQRLVTPFLLRDEARYNLELALTARIAGGEVFGDLDPVLLTVHEGADLVGAALMTPPWNLLLSPAPPLAAVPIDKALAEAGIDPPGALGPPETVTHFAAAHCARTGRRDRISREEGVYRLRTLIPPRPVPGALRQARTDEVDVVIAWERAFQAEVQAGNMDEDRVRRGVDGDMVWFWDDGGPRTLVGCGGYTPNGARIGPVYTPPEHRGRGYASAATAAVSDVLMRERGRTYCFLYTDLANPTSNKIYRAIGYEHVTDVREIAFDG
jgi:GNAT superfamily N-acetyltransferase